MRRISQRARWCGAWVVALAASAAGCSNQTPVYPVQGKVTFEGKPLPWGGSISLVPLDNRPGKTAGGEIAADGSYQLMTHAPGDGSMVGDFRVVIRQVTDKEPERTPDGKPAARSAPSLPMAERIPLIYADQQSSPLTAKVEAKTNELNFELKRKH